MSLWFDWDDGLTQSHIKKEENRLLDSERAALKVAVETDDTKYYFQTLGKITKRLKGSMDKGGNWFFITVNPKEGTELTRFIDKLNKFSIRKFIRYYYYNIEQRGESEDQLGKGIHSHILINTLLKKSKVTQYLQESFVNFVGNVRNIHQLNIILIPQSWVEDKKEYIKGNKWDEGKESKLDMDKIFRQKNNLNIYYSTQDAPTPIQD